MGREREWRNRTNNCMFSNLQVYVRFENSYIISLSALRDYEYL